MDDTNQLDSVSTSLLTEQEKSIIIKRSRAFAHIDGVFSTFFYLDTPIQEEILDQILELLQQNTQGMEFLVDIDGLHKDVSQSTKSQFPPKKIHPKWQLNQSNLHLSLSQSLSVLEQDISSILKSFEQSLSRLCIPGPFSLEFDSINFFPNLTHTQTFAALIPSKSESNLKDLQDLLKIVNTCVSKHDLPTFYDPPNFHISFCWTFGTCHSNQSTLKNIKNIPLKQKIVQTFQHVYIQIGGERGKIYQFPLIS